MSSLFYSENPSPYTVYKVRACLLSENFAELRDDVAGSTRVRRLTVQVTKTTIVHWPNHVIVADRKRYKTGE